jgi:Tol biopolymer transport system component
MKRIRIIFACVLLASALHAAESGYELFQKGLSKERADADPRGAIVIYQRVLKEHSSDRKLAAEALFRIGECQRATGDTEASKTYERIGRDYADQAKIVVQAREHLAALSTTTQNNALLSTRRVASGDGIDDSLNVARDGASVAVVLPSFDLAIRDLATGKITRLDFKKAGSVEFSRSPVLSPDQQQIAFEWASDEKTMRVASTQPGSQPRVLVRNPEVRGFAPSAWSLDGKEILTVLGKHDNTWQLAWVSVADGSVRVLKSLDWRRPENVTLSPDGKYIAYDVLEQPGGVDRDVFVLTADGRTEADAVSGRGNDRGAVWTPDGKHLIFVSNRSGGAGFYAIAIESGRPKGNPIGIKSDVGRTYPRGFAPNGSLYYVQAVGDSNILTAQLDLVTGKVRGTPSPVSQTWAGRNYSPALSPNGKWVTYLSWRNPVRYGPGRSTVVVKSLENDMEKEFSPDLQIVGKPVWYGDGRLMIASLDPKLGATLHSINVQSGVLNTVQRLDAGFFPVGIALSADGETMYSAVGAVGSSTGSIDAINLSNMQRRTLIKITAVEGATMSLSPDGKALALLMAVRSGKSVSSRILIVPTDGTKETQIFEDQHPSDLRAHYGITWSPDGKYVYFTRGATVEKCQLWRMPVTGGSPEPTGLISPMLRSASIGPGGKTTFAGGVPETFELWALDNLQSILGTKR